ncbi:MAG TPA: hypothetical protein VEH86_08480 [Candidatus Acidoferrum sp.]|nr:hypothetical protein [Candidatus Acidoferrum sp.]
MAVEYALITQQSKDECLGILKEKSIPTLLKMMQANMDFEAEANFHKDVRCGLI